MNKPSHYQLFRQIVKHFPLKHQLPWDCSKFYCAKNAWKNPAKRVYISLDFEYEWFKDHQLTCHDFFLVHHPPFLKPTAKQLEVLAKIKAVGAACLFLHTNYDLHPQGMNYQAACLFDYADISFDEFGAHIHLVNPVSIKEVANLLQLQLMPPMVQYDAFFSATKTKEMSFLLGSGASCIEAISQKPAPRIYVTGDMKWHDWHLARDLGLIVLDIHHSSEQLFVAHFEKFLKQVVDFKGLIIPLQTQMKLVFLPSLKTKF